ncbi:DedA family protein [Amycolatopsis palatopharyngis]|uniref:DedA family protein n=1 Tax=Amycolatopsis palatopharyngis TaxID=187982 RepID=UPI001FEA7A52|nr:DedA family protein [Amycolatopsis palatopharyngis]
MFRVISHVDVYTAGMLALFVIALVPLLPTEVALIGMGVAAAQQEWSLVPVVLVAAAGCLLSDQFLYTLARHGGPSVVDRLGNRRGVRTGLDWLTRQSESHARPMLIIARWLPSGGTVGALLAGSLRWPPRTFLTASAIGVTLWSGYTALLGYLGGQLVQEPGLSLLLSLGVALLLGAIISLALRARMGTPA